MTWALAWWLSLSAAWALGYVTAALLGCRCALTVPEAVEAMAEAMVREGVTPAPTATPLDSAAFAEGLAGEIESQARGRRPGTDEAEPRGADVLRDPGHL